MNRTIIAVRVAAGILLFGGVWLVTAAQVAVTQSVEARASVSGRPRTQVAPQSTGTPTISLPTAAPNFVVAGGPAALFITVQITDPTLIPGSLTLLRLNESSGVPTVIGGLVNQGNNTYGIQTSFSGAAGTSIAVQVSGAFRSVLNRVLSPAISLFVISPTTTPFVSSGQGLRFSYPDNFTVMPAQTELALDQTFSLIDRQPTDPRGLDVSIGCQVDFSVASNPSLLSLSQWLAANGRVDGVDTPLSVNGVSGVSRSFDDDITRDPATFIALPKGSRIFTFSATGSSCTSVMTRILSTATFD